MEIRWKVEDGFVGNGTHTLKIPDEELEECETEEERQALIEEYVQAEFEAQVSWCLA